MYIAISNPSQLFFQIRKRLFLSMRFSLTIIYKISISSKTPCPPTMNYFLRYLLPLDILQNTLTVYFCCCSLWNVSLVRACALLMPNPSAWTNGYSKSVENHMDRWTNMKINGVMDKSMVGWMRECMDKNSIPYGRVTRLPHSCKF